MIKDKKLKKAFVKEALGNKNYLSYRTDLMLFKVMISVFVFLASYFIYLDFIMSVLAGSLVFSIVTLINKLNVDGKNKEGEKLLLKKTKRNYFLSKIEEINTDDFELLIRFFFHKEGYRNIIKKGRGLYLAEKEGYITCIKIFKLYDGTEVEKLDIRSLLTYLVQGNIRKGYLVSTVSLSEEAENLLKKFNDKFEITIIDIDGLYSLADKHNMLPDDSFYYNKIYMERDNKEKDHVKEVKENILNKNKLSLYLPAALFFYISSIFLPENNMILYISYYFIILSIISGIYFLKNKYKRKENQ
ncbi:MAG: restriction endonuclease [Tissierellia bacterium]|nr:restriction endonuclease [Tissierellia bacterium]